jgi:hypothetical protein
MGRVLCNKHGVSGMAFVCLHIRQDILNRQKSAKIIKAIFLDKEVEKIRYDLELNYCHLCALNYNFPSEDIELRSEKHRSMYDGEIFPPTCHKCFRELNI